MNRGTFLKWFDLTDFSSSQLKKNCRCGRPLDSFGHRAACAVAGVLGRIGFPLESAAARVCREAGARVRMNVMVRDLDLWPPHRIDNRRLEVVAHGLPLHGGAQLAIDTTLVSTLTRDGTARPGADWHDGVALTEASRRKERTYLELSGEGGRARLVVLAAGGLSTDVTRLGSYGRRVQKALFYTKSLVVQAPLNSFRPFVHDTWST